MVDEYLGDVGQDRLGRLLHRLEVAGPRLDSVLVVSPPASGVNAGRPVARRSSRPPLPVGVLDVKVECEQVLLGWCANLVADRGGVMPCPRTIAVMAAWLHRRLPEVAASSWAPDCLDEVEACARRVADVIDPPPPAAAPHPGAHAPAPGVDGPGVAGAWGTSRQIEQAARLLGCPVSRTTVRAWAAAGIVSQRMLADGRVVYQLSDVLARARSRGDGDAAGMGAAL